MSFIDIPDEAVDNIISLLDPPDAAAFAVTCRRHAAACAPSSPVWRTACLRRWGRHTNPLLWGASPPSPSSFRRLHCLLHRWQTLIGFWSWIVGIPGHPTYLILFQWTPSSIIASIITLFTDGPPFRLRLMRLALSASDEPLISVLLFNTPDPFRAKISFPSPRHIAIEESHPILAPVPYERRRWHSLLSLEKIGSPSAMPLQGFWKGITDDMEMAFYLMSYNGNGGFLTCWQVGLEKDLNAGCFPVFWNAHTEFIEPPFGKIEKAIFQCHFHLQPLHWNVDFGMESVARILCVQFCCDPSGASNDHLDREGRVWVYKDGTFGFGRLHDDFIVNLRHITMDGELFYSTDMYQEFTNLM